MCQLCLGWVKGYSGFEDSEEGMIGFLKELGIGRCTRVQVAFRKVKTTK